METPSKELVEPPHERESVEMRARIPLRLVAALSLAVSIFLLGMPAASAVVPANDDFDSATAITVLPFTSSIDTTEATTAGDDPDCGGNGHTVWYSFTPTTDMSIVADTFGSDYDTTLSVYTGTRGSLTQLACNDDFLSLQSRIRFDAAGGTPHFFMVGSFGDSEGGNLVLNVAETPTRIQPAKGSTSFTETFVDTFCGFPLEVIFTFKGHGTALFDDEGDPARIILHLQLNTTLTNLDTGATLSEQDRWTEIEDFEQGTFTVVGLPFRIRTPDGRFIIRDAGKVVFDEAGNIIFEGGPHSSLEFGFDFCEALS